MTSPWPHAPILVLALALALPGCETDPDEPALTEFIAFQRDFEGFQDWEQESLGWFQSSPGHPVGERTVYIEERPRVGDEPFPVGTIIVKTMEHYEYGLYILAMVKRGADYNEGGAEGWEWFELALDDAGHPVIVWRGEDPPDGECYGCLPGTESMAEATSCNDCHVGAAEQDYVHTPLAQ